MLDCSLTCSPLLMFTICDHIKLMQRFYWSVRQKKNRNACKRFAPSSCKSSKIFNKGVFRASQLFHSIMGGDYRQNEMYKSYYLSQACDVTEKPNRIPTRRRFDQYQLVWHSSSQNLKTTATGKFRVDFLEFGFHLRCISLRIKTNFFFTQTSNL